MIPKSLNLDGCIGLWLLKKSILLKTESKSVTINV